MAEANLTRRGWLAAAAATPVAASASQAAAQATAPQPALPARAEFAAMADIYLDSGSVHPTPVAGAKALQAYALSKTRDAAAPPRQRVDVDALYAKLIKADRKEVTFVTSTTMGENLAIQALGLPQAGGRIVTDALHFFGSYYLYAELQKAGMEVVTLPMTKDGSISIEALDAAVNDRTRLVALSAVSTVNGFEHDLKRVCQIAHAHGAYVYSDSIHAVGANPFDVRDSGVDFASSASYKWLMGDFGRGFLYVRQDLFPKLKRPWYGYHQIAAQTSHVLPYDPPGDTVVDYKTQDSAEGFFGMGTQNMATDAQLAWSLDWLLRADVARIRAWRQPMMDALQTELRRRGYEVITPEGSRTQLIGVAMKDARSRLGGLLDKNKIRMTVSQNRFRVSVAVFNDMNDIDKLLETLPKTL